MWMNVLLNDSKVLSFCTSLCQNEERVNPNGLRLNTTWKPTLCWDSACMPVVVVLLLPPHTRLDTSALSLQLSADSSVIWLGGSLHPSSQCLLFLGKMAAIVLLLPVSHMNRCGWGGKKKSRAYEVCVVPQWHTAAQAYVAHRRDSKCDLDVFSITYICCA